MKTPFINYNINLDSMKFVSKHSQHASFIRLNKKFSLTAIITRKIC